MDAIGEKYRELSKVNAIERTPLRSSSTHDRVFDMPKRNSYTILQIPTPPRQLSEAR